MTNATTFTLADFNWYNDYAKSVHALLKYEQKAQRRHYGASLLWETLIEKLRDEHLTATTLPNPWYGNTPIILSQWRNIPGTKTPKTVFGVHPIQGVDPTLHMLGKGGNPRFITTKGEPVDGNHHVFAPWGEVVRNVCQQLLNTVVPYNRAEAVSVMRDVLLTRNWGDVLGTQLDMARVARDIQAVNSYYIRWMEELPAREGVFKARLEQFAQVIRHEIVGGLAGVDSRVDTSGLSVALTPPGEGGGGFRFNSGQVTFYVLWNGERVDFDGAGVIHVPMGDVVRCPELIDGVGKDGGVTMSGLAGCAVGVEVLGAIADELFVMQKAVGAGVTEGYCAVVDGVVDSLG